MSDEIKLLKNNDNREDSDLEKIEEFFDKDLDFKTEAIIFDNIRKFKK